MASYQFGKPSSKKADGGGDDDGGEGEEQREILADDAEVDVEVERK